ncbi:hypothetical protein, partial [Ruminococcus champanellensis]|uniref:hypothetical protein n=1 Tax=Ruminococcus champanellensis TaxID=1161942 RepID=UPI0023F328C3
SFSLVGLSRFSGSLGDLFILPHLPPFVNTRMLQIHSIYLVHFYAHHPKQKETHPTNRRMRFCIPYSIPQDNTAQSQPVGLAHPPHIFCAVLP